MAAETELSRMERQLSEERQRHSDVARLSAGHLLGLIDVVDGRVSGVSLPDAARLALRNELQALVALFDINRLFLSICLLYALLVLYVMVIVAVLYFM